MALPVRQQLTFWGVAAALLFGMLWALGDVLLPFILGGIIAYCLDPIADRLEAMGFSRIWAVTIIATIAVLILLPGSFYLARSLILQAAALVTPGPSTEAQTATDAAQSASLASSLAKDSIAIAKEVPLSFWESFAHFLTEKMPSAFSDSHIIRDAGTHFVEFLRSKAAAIVKYLQSSAVSLVHIVTLFLIVPVVAIYMLLDWDRMIAALDELLPRDHAPTIRAIFRDIDNTLSAFMRGMGSVSLILGSYYAIALALIGLQFGLVVGAIAGLITFIPYVGSLVGGALAVGLALVQFWGDWPMIGLVAAVFVSGQMIEGNYLTPKLVGESVGLHPVWLLLSLSVFGALFGFVGLLVAVPVAASLGVVARYGVHNYLGSRLYRGLTGQQTSPPPERTE